MARPRGLARASRAPPPFLPPSLPFPLLSPSAGLLSRLNRPARPASASGVNARAYDADHGQRGPPALPPRLSRRPERKGLRRRRLAAIVVEIDAATGETVRVFSWLLSGDHRGRPAALDVLARDDSVLIASPTAGGIVEIDRRSRTAAIARSTATPAPCSPPGTRSGPWPGPTGTSRRPDARREAPGRLGRADRRRDGPPSGDDAAPALPWGCALDDEEGRRTSVADWRDAEGDFEVLMPRRRSGGCPRVRSAGSRSIWSSRFSRRPAASSPGSAGFPSDPIVKHLSPGAGSVSWRYPGTVVVIDDTGTLDVLGPVPGSGGAACADDGSVWLLGFEGEADDARPRRCARSRSPKAGSGRFLDCGHTGPWPSSAGSSSTWWSQTTRTTRRRIQPAGLRSSGSCRLTAGALDGGPSGARP